MTAGIGKCPFYLSSRIARDAKPEESEGDVAPVGAAKHLDQGMAVRRCDFVVLFNHAAEQVAPSFQPLYLEIALHVPA